MERGVARLTRFRSSRIAIGCGAAACGSLGCKPEGSRSHEFTKLRRRDVNSKRGRWITCRAGQIHVTPFGVLDFWVIGDLWLSPQATNHRCSAANRRQQIESRKPMFTRRCIADMARINVPPLAFAGLHNSQSSPQMGASLPGVQEM